jgi:hypothetical protein
MRFRKRLKVAKGLYLNFSGSGTSLSIGGRGASVTIGKKGTYVNAGIPGTGLYTRQKISGGTTSKKNYVNNISQSTSLVKVQLDLDERGKPILNVFDSLGHEITDESIIRKVKRQEQYKIGLENLINQKIEEIDSEIKKLVEIYKSTPRLIKKESIEIKLRNLLTKTYSIKSFSLPAPNKEEIIRQLEIEAKQKINKFLFWKNSDLRKEYVEKLQDNCFFEQQKIWEDKKEKFIEKEKQEKEKQDNIYIEEYRSIKGDYENFLQGNEQYVNEKIERLIANITLPINFSIDYEYDEVNSLLHIDLDLPEIEEIPTKKVNILSSGGITIKDKTQKEIREEYACCTIGLSFYFAGEFFNISSNINNIIISGYTQRINPKTGNIGDDYVYSIIFDRTNFNGLNIKGINPIEAVANFESRLNITSNFELKIIEPFFN